MRSAPDTPGNTRTGAHAGSPGPVPASPGRILSLDVIRGAVMLLMAVDHARWFLSASRFDPTDLDRATAALFLSRWITHFCAPAFLFLAGAGAFLHGRRVRSRAALARFLLTRGVWLILVEMTAVRLGWTFNFDYGAYLFGGVLWMIGCCMILLAALVFLPTWVVGGVGVAVIACHGALESILPTPPAGQAVTGAARLWQVLYFGGTSRLGEDGPSFSVLFSVVPWVGVIAAGYAFGPVMLLPAERRRRICIAAGMAAVAGFVVLRGLNLLDPRPWSPQESPAFTVLSFLNADKYPASTPFLLMTLGPTLALVPLLEHARGPLARGLAVFGRAPFLFYVLHLPVIHLAAVLLSLARYGEVIPWLGANHPMLAPLPPAGYGYGLGTVYLASAAVAALLYVPCRRLAELKARRPSRWLSLL
ncbi:MAG TPA: heparan-alpha-glucosaminide N-acetyltransferase domain-containing protein [Longimicrobiaceae bacterium]|nr:heparan-alpha-glucosaminide N-acetyltransferase domain-containing protein [Longimicrobiaceae bacterium]